MLVPGSLVTSLTLHSHPRSRGERSGRNLGNCRLTPHLVTASVSHLASVPSFLASYSRLFILLSLGDRSFAPHVTLRPSHLLPVGRRRETTSVTREVTRRVTDMEAGWEGSFIAFAMRALHAPPTSHKKSEETE